MPGVIGRPENELAQMLRTLDRRLRSLETNTNADDGGGGGDPGTGTSVTFYADRTPVTDSTLTVYPLTTTPILESVVASLNGLILDPFDEYTLSGASITVNFALTVGDTILVTYAA